MNDNYSLCTRLVAFSNDLDMLCKNYIGFFNVNIINLISKYFGYKDCVLVIYNNHEYFDSVGTSKACNMLDYYAKVFYAKDQYAAYINKKFPDADISRPNVVKVSECLEDYLNSSYREYLETAGMGWVATMIFGNYRIAIFKEEKDEDFSDKEMEHLRILASIISSRAQFYNSINNVNTSLNIKNKILDSISIGSITLNESFKVMDYNEFAAYHISTVLQYTSIESAIPFLLSLFSIKDTASGVKIGKKTIVYKNYNIQIYNQYFTDKNKYVHLYYSIIISNNEQKDTVSVHARQKLAELYSLSPKEINVLEKLVESNTYQEIANALFISINTVRTHLKNIYKKTGVNNQRMLIYVYNELIKN